MSSRTQRYIKRAISRQSLRQRQVTDLVGEESALTRCEVSRLARLFAKRSPAEIIEYFNRAFGIPEGKILSVRDPAPMPRTPENERLLETLLERAEELKKRQS